MSTSARQPRFSLSIQGVEPALQVLAFKGEEAISSPFSFDVELVSDRSSIDLASLLHQSAFLAFDEQDNGIHGQISAVSKSCQSARLTRYQLTLVPRVAYLAHRTDQRIFQHQTVQQIIEQVLKGHGILGDSYRFALNSVYLPREYCVQYGESDLHFIQRLCFEEGLHYHFRHAVHGHELVFGDELMAFVPAAQATPYHSGEGLLAPGPAIDLFEVQFQARSNRVTLRDYNFNKASRVVQADRNNMADRAGPELEHYTYPGRFTDTAEGERYSQRALERHQAAYAQASGRSHQPCLRSGHYLQLKEHPTQACNGDWLLTRIEHQGKQPQVLEEQISSSLLRCADGFIQGYRNTFHAIPQNVAYRSPTRYEKPRLLGSQSARVCGPANEAIFCDALGRIKVQFHWDREGSQDENSSCWLRVVSAWAGERYGAVTVPRVGMEVLVSYLEGDIDQPVVSGCLINSLHPVAHALPANKTRSVLRSKSTPGASGYNELQLEDRKGCELIYLHAQRDMQQHIKHDSRVQVAGEFEHTIKGNSTVVFKAQEQHTVGADRKTRLLADDYLDIAQSSHCHVGRVMTVEAGQQIHFKAGTTLNINGGATQSLMAGGQHLLLTPAGIFSSTPVQPGGVPVQGTPASSGLPGGVEALLALALVSQTQAFQDAAKSIEPVCMACEALKDTAQ